MQLSVSVPLPDGGFPVPLSVPLLPGVVVLQSSVSFPAGGGGGGVVVSLVQLQLVLLSVPLVPFVLLVLLGVDPVPLLAGG